MNDTRKLGIAEAFKVYGAKLKNVRWALSAIAPDGALVLSCWQHAFKTRKGVTEYQDDLSTWGDENRLGRELLSAHLTQALQKTLDVRLVVAHLSASSKNARSAWFHVKPEVVGKVTHFDGAKFSVEFKKATSY